MCLHGVSVHTVALAVVVVVRRLFKQRRRCCGADLLSAAPRDDVRVEAQWQEHVCRSNLVSGVSARVEGRGAESLCLLALGQGLGRAIGGVPCSSAVVSHKHT